MSKLIIFIFATAGETANKEYCSPENTPERVLKNLLLWGGGGGTVYAVTKNGFVRRGARTNNNYDV